MLRPRTKPYAARTVAVTGRVPEEFERQLTAQAAERQLSMSQYVHHQLAYAASKHYEVAELQRELRRQEARILQLEQQAAQQQEQFAWYGGRIEDQIRVVLHNMDCLRQLHQQYGSTPIPVAVAKQMGFEASHLLAGVIVEGQYGYAIGDYVWRHTDKHHTHFLIFPHGLPVR